MRTGIYRSDRPRAGRRRCHQRACAWMASAAAAATSAAVAPPTSAALIFQSGTLGPTGQAGGYSLSAANFSGVRFEVTSPVTADRIGAHLGTATNPSATLFGALVQLSGPADMPNSTDLSTVDVLATTTFNVPIGSNDIVGKFSNTLLPAGWYALVYGSGRFGATGSGMLANNNPQVGSPSYFFRSGGAWSNSSNSSIRMYIASPSSRFWTNPAGGSWEIPSNWSSGGVPDTFEDVHLEAGGTYNIAVGANTSVHNVTVEGDHATLALGGHRLSSSGEISISPGFNGPASTLNVTDGTLARPTVQDLIVGHRSAGAMTVNNLGMIHGPASGLVVGCKSSGTLNLTNGSISTMTGRVADDQSLSEGSASGGSGMVWIGAGGTWNVGGSFSVGRNGSGNVTMNGGLLSVVGTTKLYSYFGTTFTLQEGTLQTASLDTSSNPSNFIWTGGTLRIGGPVEIALGGPLGDNVSVSGPAKSFINDGGTHVAPGAQLSVGPGGYIGAPITNDGAFTQTGGITTVTNDAGLTGFGTTNVTGGVVSAMRIRQQSLTIGGTGRIALNFDALPGTNINSRAGAISITGSGKLDLSDKRLIQGGGFPMGSWNGSAYTGTIGLIQSGRNGGPPGSIWAGPGIITTRPDATVSQITSIGIATAGDALGTTVSTPWSGELVSSNTVLVMYTWGGDANLDGKIDIDDYGQIDFNVGSSGSVFGWYNGDFNYDGKINIDDYGIIDFNVAAQGPPFVTGGAALAPGEFNGSPAAGGAAAVPEPAMLVFAAVGPLLCRRRCRAGEWKG